MYKLSDIVYAVARRMPTQEDAKKYRKIVEQSGARELKIDGAMRDWRLTFERGAVGVAEHDIHVEYDRRNADGYLEWNSLMDIQEDGQIIVYDSGLDTFGGGPADAVIIYEGSDLTKAVRAMLEYRPVEYGWIVGDPTTCNYQTYATRRPGAKKYKLKRVE